MPSESPSPGAGTNAGDDDNGGGSSSRPGFQPPHNTTLDLRVAPQPATGESGPGGTAPPQNPPPSTPSSQGQQGQPVQLRVAMRPDGSGANVGVSVNGGSGNPEEARRMAMAALHSPGVRSALAREMGRLRQQQAQQGQGQGQVQGQRQDQGQGQHAAASAGAPNPRQQTEGQQQGEQPQAQPQPQPQQQPGQQQGQQQGQGQQQQVQMQFPPIQLPAQPGQSGPQPRVVQRIVNGQLQTMVQFPGPVPPGATVQVGGSPPGQQQSGRGGVSAGPQQQPAAVMNGRANARSEQPRTTARQQQGQQGQQGQPQQQVQVQGQQGQTFQFQIPVAAGGGPPPPVVPLPILPPGMPPLPGSMPPGMTAVPIPMPPGAVMGPVPVPAAGLGGGGRFPGQGQGHFHVRLPQVQVPPLEPQPLPFHHHAPSSGGSDSEDGDVGGSGRRSSGAPEASAAASSSQQHEHPDFECSICYETMDDPCLLPCCGAGSESSKTRFCRGCLQRIWRDGAAREMDRAASEMDAAAAAALLEGRTPDGGPSAKCPCCREPFQWGDVKGDDDLRRKMEGAGRVVCPYPNCGKRMLLREVKSHTAQCEYVPVRCRYASFGCKWTGPKRDVGPHEEVGCPLAKSGKIIESLRRTRAELGHTVAQLGQTQQGLRATQQLLHQHQRMLMAVQQRERKDPESLRDVLQCTFASLVDPAKFLREKERWKFIWGNAERRASAENILLGLPIALWISRIGVSGIRRLFRFEDLSSADDLFYALDDMLLAFTLFGVGALILACFHVDRSPANAWTVYPLRPQNVMRSSRAIVRDAAGICAAVAVFAAIEFEGGFRGVALWGCVCLASQFIPRMVGSILRRAAVPGGNAAGGNSNNPANVPDGEGTEGRAYSVVMFGLRYGLLANLCGFVHSLDAVLVLRMLSAAMKLPETLTLERTECVFSDLADIADLGMMVNVLVIRAAVVGWRIASAGGDDSETDAEADAGGDGTKALPVSLSPLVESAMAFGLLVLMNHAVHRIEVVSDKIGKKLASDAVAAASQGGQNSTNNQAKLAWGSMAVCTWTFLMVSILVA